jgi:hypothetical protein
MKPFIYCPNSFKANGYGKLANSNIRTFEELNTLGKKLLLIIKNPYISYLEAILQNNINDQNTYIQELNDIFFQYSKKYTNSNFYSYMSISLVNNGSVIVAGYDPDPPFQNQPILGRVSIMEAQMNSNIISNSIRISNTTNQLTNYCAFAIGNYDCHIKVPAHIIYITVRV